MRRAPTKRVFPNRYNGVGGHIERDEDPLSSARREIQEETGLDVTVLELRAIYNIDTGGSSGIILFVFIGQAPSREVLSQSAEGTLHWIPMSEIARYDLVEDLPLILPRVLDANRAVPWFVHVSYDSEDQIIMRFAEDSVE
ncbi:MAG: NUDIX domain-containing protein [Anaerolineae bacterium]|nr:NUDIX domain-containing protein [Anaerolineae bacterium]NUQ02568.1 NUDIX domain-containing protein [Anaerolineae bacterium]